jgi:hypothetical protein
MSPTPAPVARPLLDSRCQRGVSLPVNARRRATNQLADEGRNGQASMSRRSGSRHAVIAAGLLREGRANHKGQVLQ